MEKDRGNCQKAHCRNYGILDCRRKSHGNSASVQTEALTEVVTEALLVVLDIGLNKQLDPRSVPENCSLRLQLGSEKFPLNDPSISSTQQKKNAALGKKKCPFRSFVEKRLSFETGTIKTYTGLWNAELYIIDISNILLSMDSPCPFIITTYTQ